MSLRSVGRQLAIAGVTAVVAATLGVSAAAAQPLPKLPQPSTGGATGQYRLSAEVPPSIGARLSSGQSLDEGHSLESTSGQHIIVINGYAGHKYGIVLTGFTGDPVPLSQTGSNNDVENKLIMQGDGNLVLYSNGKATFSSRTNGMPGATAVLQDDRNLVVYYQGRAVWASGTAMTNASSFYDTAQNYEAGYLEPGWFLQSANRRCKLVMQGDGNLVLYTSRGVVWASRTNGNPGASAVMQVDGNIVVYSSAGKVLWHSGTARNVRGANVLSLQNDGNLVLYFTGDGVRNQVRWHTRTSGLA